jgi:hypothetical protein
MAFRTEFPFKLPKGYVDEAGVVHQNGTMRLATAEDEILPMRDPRVQQNPGFLTVILLARVITKLGDVKVIDTQVIGKLFTADFAYLQNLYREINEMDKLRVRTSCPECKKNIEVEVSLLGELGVG